MVLKCKTGAPIRIINLIKKDSKNESKLGKLFDDYFQHLFTQGKRFADMKGSLSYDWFDFLRCYDSKNENVLAVMQGMANKEFKDINPTFYDFTEDSEGIFASNPLKQSQHGVIRVNCVDCLDRTNNAMACISSVVFAEMLQLMNVNFKEFYAFKTNSVYGELLQMLLNMFAVFLKL